MKNPAQNKTVAFAIQHCRVYLDEKDVRAALENAKPVNISDSILLADWKRRLTQQSASDTFEIRDLGDIPVISDAVRSLAVRKIKKGDAVVYSGKTNKPVSKIIIRRKRNGDCREVRFFDAADHSELLMIADKCKNGKLY